MEQGKRLENQAIQWSNTKPVFWVTKGHQISIIPTLCESLLHRLYVVSNAPMEAAAAKNILHLPPSSPGADGFDEAC